MLTLSSVAKSSTGGIGRSAELLHFFQILSSMREWAAVSNSFRLQYCPEVWFDSRCCFDPFVGVRVGQALHPGPPKPGPVSDDSFFSAFQRLGSNGLGPFDAEDYASVPSDGGGDLTPVLQFPAWDPRCRVGTPDPYEEAEELFGADPDGETVGLEAAETDMVFQAAATPDAAAAAATLADDAAAIDHDAAAADDWEGASPNARVADVPAHTVAHRCEIDRAPSTPVHADGAAGAPGSACTIPVPTDSSALQAAVDIINLAETAAAAGDADAALSAVSRHTWSAVYCSILWAAAGGESAHPVVDWLTVAARHCFVPMAEGDRAGPDIVRDAWAAVRAAVGAAGVHSHAELVGWYAAMFGSTVRPGGHLRRAAQHFLVDSSVEAAGGKPLLEQLLAALTPHIAAQPCLARLLATECEVAQDETSRCDRRGVRSTRMRGRAALHPPPAEVLATSHSVETRPTSPQQAARARPAQPVRNNLTRGARDVIDAANLAQGLAHRAGQVAPGAQIPGIIRRQKWSPLNVPLMWAAAGPHDTTPVLEWLINAATLVPGELEFSDARIGASVAARAGWVALRGVMRTWGIDTQEKLSRWLQDEGYTSPRPDCHIAARAQEHLIPAAVREDARVALLEETYVAVVNAYCRLEPELATPPAPDARRHLRNRARVVPFNPPGERWRELGDVDLREVFSLRVPMLKTCPHFLKGRLRHAFCVALQERRRAQQASDEQGLKRAWKLFGSILILLLQRPGGNGYVGRDELERRADEFGMGA